MSTAGARAFGDRSFGEKAFDAVFDSQRVFRCVLQATAQPGKLFTLPPVGVAPPETVALALLDHEVTFCVVGAEAGERLSRMTGSREVPLEEAEFALLSGGDSGGAVSKLGRGDLERPERGATAIYAVERLGTGPVTLRLSGPGVPGTRTLGVEGLPKTEIEAIQKTRADYPLGVDVYLVDGAGQLAGLPRSTRLEIV